MSLQSLFRDVPVKRKLLYIVALSLAVAAVFAVTAAIVAQWFVSRTEMKADLVNHARVVGENTRSALLFGDREAAQQTLGALANIKGVEFAEVHDGLGDPFALYVRPGIAPPAFHRLSRGEYFLSSLTHIEVSVPILDQGEQVGSIHVFSSLQPMYEKMAWDVATLAAAILGSLLIVAGLIARFHVVITRSIADLAGLMDAVSSTRNYALRSGFRGKDELGALARGLDEMLAQIQARDEVLAQHRAQLEEEVAQRTASLTEAQRIAHLGNWEWDIVNDTLIWSDEIYRIFGLAPQQFGATYEAFMRHVHPDDRQDLEESVRRALGQPGQPYSREHRVVRSDGSVRHVLEQGEVRFDEGGRAVRMLGTVQDITERKRAEMELRQRTAFFEALVTTSADGILVVDTQGRKVLQNRRTIELLKIPEDIAADPDDGPQMQFVINQAVDPQQFADKVRYLYAHPEETSSDEIVLKDGTILERYSAPVIDEDGQHYGRIWSFRDITERKRAEAAIRQQQKFTSLIIETIPLRVFWKDRELRYLGCNTLFAKDAGLSRPDQLIGKTDFEMSWRDRAELYRADDGRVMESNTPTLSYDEPQTTPDGGLIWLRTSKLPLRNEENEVVGVLGVYEDITEHKLAAQALEESERKFRSIVDASVDGILVADVNTHEFVIANRAICDMLGYSMEEVCRLGMADIHPAKALPDVQHKLEGQLKGEIRVVQDIPVKRKDGSVFFADVSGSPMVLKGQTFLVNVFHDVTERMRAEERIRASEARYRRIFEYANDIIFLLNPDGTFQSISPSLMRIAGWQADEWNGKPFAPLVHPDDLPEADAAFQRLLAGESIASLRLRIARKSGDYFGADLSATPLGSGEIMGIARDVTERQRAEAEIKKLNEELDAKVQERTRQLLEAQEDLVRKEKLAVLGQVAGSVGHELRNPLGVMNNAVYFLQTVLSDADETVKEYLGIIKDEIADSERIVSDLLDSVRTKPPRPEAVGADKLIGQVLHKIDIPSSVAVRLDLPATLPSLHVDAQQIQQVFRNLISNGVEAMPEGGELEIRAVENKADGQIVISVRDTGTGIAPDILPRLFQPLFTTKARGIGLGLVVVKNLTEANGGTLTVQSEVGQGTTFTVTLPAARSAGEEN